MGGGGYPDAYAAGRYPVIGIIKPINLQHPDGKGWRKKVYPWNRMALATMKGIPPPG